MTANQNIPRDDFDRSRAENYQVLALLLSAPPSRAVLDLIADLKGDGSALGRAWDALAQRAGPADPAGIEREFFELFTGVGRGELLPYASFYVTGFLHERPLAELRGDLMRLGIARQPDDHDPEDRIALLCAVMAAYARGDLPKDQPTDAAGAEANEAVAGPADTQPDEASFFARHLAPWAALFFEDLDQAPAADFYRAVARVGKEFMKTEQQAFALGAQDRAVA